MMVRWLGIVMFGMACLACAQPEPVYDADIDLTAIPIEAQPSLVPRRSKKGLEMISYMRHNMLTVI